MSLRPSSAGSGPAPDTAVPHRDRPDAGGAGYYRERLLVPVSYWLIAVPVVLVLGAEAYFFVDGFIPPLVMAAFYVIAAVFYLNWSSAAIEVTGSELRAGGAALPLSAAGEVIALDDRQSAALRGPKADPAARILLRPYLKRAVYVAADQGDGVPYWLIATRHPEDLAAAIERARSEAGHESVG